MIGAEHKTTYPIDLRDEVVGQFNATVWQGFEGDNVALVEGRPAEELGVRLRVQMHSGDCVQGGVAVVGVDRFARSLKRTGRTGRKVSRVTWVCAVRKAIPTLKS